MEPGGRWVRLDIPGEFKFTQNVNLTPLFIDGGPLRIPLEQSEPRNSSLGSMITRKSILLVRRNLTARGHPPVKERSASVAANEVDPHASNYHMIQAKWTRRTTDCRDTTIIDYNTHTRTQISTTRALDKRPCVKTLELTCVVSTTIPRQ